MTEHPAAPTTRWTFPKDSVIFNADGSVSVPARSTPAEALDVERNGWWHPADCTNQHNEHGNCLGDDGMVVGWRDPVEYARLRSPESDEAR